MSDGWESLAVRQGWEKPRVTLHEDLPPHLGQPALAWFQQVITNGRARLVGLRLQFDPTEGGTRQPSDGTLRLVLRCLESGDARAALNIVDAYLAASRQYSPVDTARHAADLDRILTEGSSAWRVNERHDGLERRVDPTTQAAYERVREQEPDSVASRQLAIAWQEAFGLHPDPSKAYSAAVKAVEAVAVPLVLPNDAGATLGKVIGELRANQSRWIVGLTDQYGQPLGGAVVVETIEALWKGQADRHEGNQPSVAIEQSAAEAAVHLAVMLVEWFRAGVLRKR
jgi:hypothetical protein